MKRRVISMIVVTCLLVISLEAVTVNPSLCPTNKIAPHKRLASWEYGTGRTFGAFYDLLAPGNPQSDGPDLNDLQEQPQEDDPTDCGEIEDYDENDLSSITPQGNRRQGHRDSRGFFFESLFKPPQYPQRPPSNYPQRPPNYPPPNYPPKPPNYPQNPPNYPQRPPNYPRPPSTNRPQKPSYSTKPPYWSGGFFGSNGYRPPLHQNPSDSIKPIHEYSEESHVPYRPNLVGAPLGHVVGASPIIPTVQDETTTSRTFYNRLRSSTPPSTVYPTRRPSPRKINNNSIFGSFVDLLFK